MSDQKISQEAFREWRNRSKYVSWANNDQAIKWMLDYDNKPKLNWAQKMIEAGWINRYGPGCIPSSFYNDLKEAFATLPSTVPEKVTDEMVSLFINATPEIDQTDSYFNSIKQALQRFLDRLRGEENRP